MKALVVLFKGVEEIEAVTVIDVLRRADIEVKTAGFASNIIEGSHKIRVFVDMSLEDAVADDFDALVLPGGSGYKNLINSDEMLKLIKEFDTKNKIIAAICASPAVLGRAGILEDKKATIYPGMEQAIPRSSSEKLIMDKNVITSQGPGTAMVFALKLVEALAGRDKAEKLKKEMIA